MLIGRDRGLGQPENRAELRSELAVLMGTRSADRIRASGMYAASNRLDTCDEIADFDFYGSGANWQRRHAGV